MSSVFDQTAATEAIKSLDVSALVDLTAKIAVATKEHTFVKNAVSQVTEPE